MQFLKNNTKVLTLFRLLVLGFVYFGAVVKVDVVWDMGDLTMGTMAFINLIAILLLSRYVFVLIHDYQSQLKLGVAYPIFKLDNHPKLKQKSNLIFGSPVELIKNPVLETGFFVYY